ncbi:MAG: hypothetical protein H6728_00740 [Myxococcales bacterium]|nr:hypothetical protein [Myxococcales bacterium]
MSKAFFPFALGVFSLLHPHLWQKLQMLRDYLTHSHYQFWTTFQPMDVFDLLMHAAFPIVFFTWGVLQLRSPEPSTHA